MDDINEQMTALDGLTEKQREVLSLISEGMTSKEIARKLAISESAVNQRIEVVRQRLGGLPRTQIARIYRRMSTVVLTIPASNSLTGKSIQLQSDGLVGQQSEAEGAEVSTALSQASVPFGSYPSTPFFTALTALLDGPSRTRARLIAIVVIALGIMALAVLSLAALQALVQLLAAFQ
ncbi:MAG: helix-turn-helix transcriptional regulator [Novosphingobium sp.]|uniref:helix-turn-helix domain-containing protein n=1 Tax=Novosphingobium sp. TaxID=1874826 RepID=UPI0017D291CE|nr:helix-turn-helix transcriptional regulator [Novosphingobium sp.]